LAAGRRAEARVGWLALLVVSALSAAVTAGPMLASSRLYFDTLGVYPYFFDNFDSLLRFGEPAWWSPKVVFGFPTYFYSLLGVINAGKPAFVFVGLILWSLGRIGVEVPDLVFVYILYFGVLIPFLFLFGVWLVGRRLLRSRTALLYVLIVAAFSPGVVLNLSDPGILEFLAYCLFCVAAYLDFVARPSARSFLIACVCAGLVSLAFSQYALMTAIPWLPLVVAGSAAVSRPARRALRSVPLWRWPAAAMLLFVTASPSLIAYVQERDELTQLSLDGFEYSFARIKPGNPLEFLLASVPAITFEWDRYDQAEGSPLSEFRAAGLQPGRHGSFGYLGVLAIPLAGLGLVYGRRRLRLPLFIMLVVAMTVLALPGVSPPFSALLVFPSPLRSMNHYGDLLYRGGGFLLILFAAGLGLEAAIRRRDVLRRLPPLLAATSLLSLAVWLHFGRPIQSLVGFTAAVTVSLFVLLLWAGRLPRRSRSGLLAAGVLGLTAIDVSTAAFWHIRLVMMRPNQQDASGDIYAQIQSVVLMRDVKRMGEANLPLERVPPVSGFCSAYSYQGLPTRRDFALAFDVAEARRSLPLPALLRSDDSLRSFFDAPAGGCRIRFESSGNYNSKRVAVTAEQPSLVLFGDAYSKQWRATIDGKPAPVLRALGAFKAVAVPAGSSVVELRFDPPLVGLALAAAYGILAGLGILALRLPERDEAGENNPRRS